MFDTRVMLDAVRHWGEEAAKAADSPLWPLSESELIDLLRAVERVRHTMAALQIRLVREAGCRELPAQQGHRTVAGWLRAQLLLDPQPARELADAAALLRTRPVVERALIDGTIDLRQAAAIAAAVNAVPATLADVQAMAGASETADPSVDTLGSSAGPLSGAPGALGSSAGPPSGAPGLPTDASAGPSGDPLGPSGGRLGPSGGPLADLSADASDVVGDRAEATLIEMADQFPAYLLRKLGDRILAHVAPEIAEQADEAALRRAETRAHRRRSLTLSLPVDGMVRLSGLLGVEEAAIVGAALQPLSGPIPDDDRSVPERRADALVDICRLALRTGELPHDGGEPPQLAVTVKFDPLTATFGPGQLPDAERVSAETARRLACDAQILPIVLGGASQVLDAGRARRLATGPLRRALTVRDGGCAFPGCDRPARWTDAHHLIPWSEGGATSLDNLVLLCRHHHRTIHDPATGWTVRLGPDQLPEFIPPPSTDPIQRPRRNLYHHRT